MDEPSGTTWVLVSVEPGSKRVIPMGTKDPPSFNDCPYWYQRASLRLFVTVKVEVLVPDGPEHEPSDCVAVYDGSGIVVVVVEVVVVVVGVAWGGGSGIVVVVVVVVEVA